MSSLSLKGWLRYAGGKRSLADTVLQRFRETQKRRLTSTCVGGGSVELAICAGGSVEALRLADANPAVRAFYAAPLDATLLSFVAHMEFSRLRGAINDAVTGRKPLPPRVLGALFWVYSRRCLNGIVRCNRKGELNVAEGRTASGKAPFITHVDMAAAADLSKMLHSRPVTVLSDAVDAVLLAEDEFVFSDPPYTGGFVGYTAEGWTKEDDVRLFEALADAHKRSCPVLLCQPDTDWARDLAEQILPGWEVSEVKMARSVNSDGQGRAPVGELLIWSGE